MYLSEKAGIFSEVKADYTRQFQQIPLGQLRSLQNVSDVINYIKTIQRLLGALLKCKVCCFFVALVSG